VFLVTRHVPSESACEPFYHPGWMHEEKVDGWRILAY
jgi:bifunctional non-homologous end joining protein LigD